MAIPDSQLRYLIKYELDIKVIILKTEFFNCVSIFFRIDSRISTAENKGNVRKLENYKKFRIIDQIGLRVVVNLALLALHEGSLEITVAEILKFSN